jgi:hypothetical protein
MADQPTPPREGPRRSGAQPASFEQQYRAQNKPVFSEVVSRDLSAGGDPVARARAHAEQGKPEFVLAYLLVADLPDNEKRELYAHAYERRAQITERKADEFDRKFHRPFPLLRLDASKDRATAQRIRAGGALRPGLGRPLPTL